MLVLTNFSLFLFEFNLSDIIIKSTSSCHIAAVYGVSCDAHSTGGGGEVTNIGKGHFSEIFVICALKSH